MLEEERANGRATAATVAAKAKGQAAVIGRGACGGKQRCQNKQDTETRKLKISVESCVSLGHRHTKTASVPHSMAFIHIRSIKI